MTQSELQAFLISFLTTVQTPFIDPCTGLLVGNCSICPPVSGDGVVITNTLSFNPATNEIISGVNGIFASVPIVLDAGDILTSAGVTINGTPFASGSTSMAVLNALSLLAHPPIAVTNLLAPFSFNAGLQTLNIPLQDTFVLGGGNLTIQSGSGGAPVVVPYLDNATTVLTTAAVTIGSTVNAIGTTLQSILNQISANDSFVVNAGTTAVNTDDALGAQTIDLGQRIHFWSSDSSILFDVNATDIDMLVQDFKIPAGLTVQGTPYVAGTSVLTILAALAGGSGGAANLSLINQTVSGLEVANSNGTGFTLVGATNLLAGLFTSGQLANLNNLVTLTGLAANSLNFGPFAGSLIPDNLTLKPVLQSLETGVESKQQKVQYKKDGVNLGIAGEVVTVDLIGANLNAALLSGTLTVSVTPSGVGGIVRSVVAPTGGHSGSVVFSYSGSVAPTFNKDTPSIWSITVPAGTELLSADIYSPTADNPGSNLTLNINTASAVYNQGMTTMHVPLISGVALGGGAGTVPGNYAPTTGSTNLLSSVNTIPVTGDIQLIINNFNNANALGVGATLIKLVW